MVDDDRRAGLNDNVRRLRTVFSDTAAWLVRVHQKIPTLDNVAMAIFHERAFYERVEKIILEVFLKCMTASASEGVIESYGSVMEHILSHYTTFREDDDGRAQRHMYNVFQNAPQLPLAGALLDEGCKRYFLKRPRAKFAAEGLLLGKQLHP